MVVERIKSNVGGIINSERLNTAKDRNKLWYELDKEIIKFHIELHKLKDPYLKYIDPKWIEGGCWPSSCRKSVIY